MHYKESAAKTLRSFFYTLPLMLGIILLISLVLAVIPPEMISALFSGGPSDSLIGAAVGSIAGGSPVASYVIGGELLSAGVSLLAVTAFLVAWVTVGLIQLPVEMDLLGRRFAIIRNALSFVFAILVASLVSLVLEVLAA